MEDMITFTLYQIDYTLPEMIIGDCLFADPSDDTPPCIYKLERESIESSDLDALYKRYTSDERPSKHCCREISFTDVVEIEASSGECTFYICHMFGWTEFDFDKSKVPNIKTFYDEYN